MRVSTLPGESGVDTCDLQVSMQSAVSADDTQEHLTCQVRRVRRPSVALTAATTNLLMMHGAALDIRWMTATVSVIRKYVA